MSVERPSVGLGLDRFASEVRRVARRRSGKAPAGGRCPAGCEKAPTRLHLLGGELPRGRLRSRLLAIGQKSEATSQRRFQPPARPWPAFSVRRVPAAASLAGQLDLREPGWPHPALPHELSGLAERQSLNMGILAVSASRRRSPASVLLLPPCTDVFQALCSPFICGKGAGLCGGNQREGGEVATTFRVRRLPDSS